VAFCSFPSSCVLSPDRCTTLPSLPHPSSPQAQASSTAYILNPYHTSQWILSELRVLRRCRTRLYVPFPWAILGIPSLALSSLCFFPSPVGPPSKCHFLFHRNSEPPNRSSCPRSAAPQVPLHAVVSRISCVCFVKSIQVQVVACMLLSCKSYVTFNLARVLSKSPTFRLPLLTPTPRLCPHINMAFESSVYEL
ncbi:hypothetical protein DFH07DRAFT_15649, partial [Mycena maculata]